LQQQDKGALNIIYALQWVVYHLGVVISVPLMVGSSLGLDAQGVQLLLQTCFVITGLASLLQVLWGHGALIIEGPVATWGAAYIILAQIALKTGQPVALLRTNIEGAMIFAGITLIILGAVGFIRWARVFFTPRITGMLLLLLGIQIGTVGIEGFFGSWQMFLVAILVLAIIVYLSLNGRGLWKSSATFLGIIVGWVLSLLLGKVNIAVPVNVINLPRVFPWGIPTLEISSSFSLTVLGLLLITNLVGSISASESVMGNKLSLKRYDRGLALSGLSNLMTGFLGGIGTIPLAISASLISLSGLKARIPFILSCFMFMAIGIFAPLGALAASIPQQIAAAILLISGSSLAITGLKDIVREDINTRESFVIGLPLLAGIGVMILPANIWQGLPGWIVGFLSNGVIVGVLICIALEHILLPQKNKIVAQGEIKAKNKIALK